jgi:hypothetical protein
MFRFLILKPYDVGCKWMEIPASLCPRAFPSCTLHELLQCCIHFIRFLLILSACMSPLFGVVRPSPTKRIELELASGIKLKIPFQTHCEELSFQISFLLVGLRPIL